MVSICPKSSKKNSGSFLFKQVFRVGKSMTFVGLDNYIKIFTHDTLFWKGVRFTLKFAIFYVIIVNLLSLTVAIVMARENKVNSVGRAFYYVPYIISLTAILNTEIVSRF